MRVPAFIGHAQNHLHTAWTSAGQIARKASTSIAKLPEISKTWIVAQFTAIKSFWEASVWTPFLKPLHERHIEPLGKPDAVYLTASAIVAASIAVLTPFIFGKALFAIAAVSSVTIFLGACTFASYRAQRHHSEKAWDFVEHMRGAANSTTARRNYFTKMHQDMTELQKPLYSHHAEDVKVLAKQLEAFKKVASAPYYEDRKTLVTQLITHLKTLVTAPGDTPLLEQLEQEVAHVGTERQNFGEIESKRLALSAIQTAAVRQELGNLATRIDELRQSTEGISFAESKRVFDEQLKQLQSKLKGEKGPNLVPPNLDTIVDFN